MQVRATAQGYYNLILREPGDEFTIKSPKDFSGVWMVDIDKKPTPPPKPSGKKGAVASKEAAPEPAEKGEAKEDVI